MSIANQIQTESYLGNPNVKRDGVQQQWTSELVQEYSKCMKDPTYFCEKYVKVIHNRIKCNSIIIDLLLKILGDPYL